MGASTTQTHKVSLSDIATMAGVSLATVSKVLNGRADISDATREKVQKILATSGYVRKANATNNSDMIEVVFEKFDNMWALELLTGVIQVASKQGLNVAIVENGDRAHPDSTWVNKVINHRPYGIILVFSDLTKTEKNKLSRCDIPYVTVDPSGDPYPDNMSVQADNWTGGLIATRHLLALGHTRIGIITGPQEMMCSKARLDGYSAALEERGLTVEPSLIRIGNFTTQGGFREGLKLLSDSKNRPSAIFAGSDLQAMGVYEAARRLNIRIPQDLSVVGFDDLQLSGYMGPALTTIRQPLRDMAASASQMLIATRTGQDCAKRTILPTTLIQRDSTRHPEDND
ncbi:MAG: LacI family DNA-binding transcriptional regulator [Bifidobacteriaceae bacterium]|jgi:LacI family transcriptional regulator|nr:LacI family DNA-binding transcriptional regulator [Bifidobacteriaceae bacterium]